MATTYTEAGDVVEALAKKLMREKLPDLAEAKVNIGYLFAANPDGDAIMHHGYPAAAVVRIVNLRDRAAGMPDAMVVIDESRWKDANADERLALLHHELYHLILKREVSGVVVTDDLGRPKFKMRKHDFEHGGFYEIIEKYTVNAIELQNLAAVNKELRVRNLIQQNMWG